MQHQRASYRLVTSFLLIAPQELPHGCTRIRAAICLKREIEAARLQAEDHARQELARAGHIGFVADLEVLDKDFTTGQFLEAEADTLW